MAGLSAPARLIRASGIDRDQAERDPDPRAEVRDPKFVLGYRLRGRRSLGYFCTTAGAMTHLTNIRQGFDNWDISQRDPTIRSVQNLFGGRFVGSSLSGF